MTCYAFARKWALAAVWKPAENIISVRLITMAVVCEDTSVKGDAGIITICYCTNLAADLYEEFEIAIQAVIFASTWNDIPQAPH
jgi:hypothetical protein